jgi:hypothetical protein
MLVCARISKGHRTQLRIDIGGIGRVASSNNTPTNNADSADAAEFEELLTQGEVARMLRVDPGTVRSWTRLGYLSPVRMPAVRRNGKPHALRYELSDVRRFIAQSRCQ